MSDLLVLVCGGKAGPMKVVLVSPTSFNTRSLAPLSELRHSSLEFVSLFVAFGVIEEDSG